MEEFILSHEISKNKIWQEEQKKLFQDMYKINENDSICVDGKLIRLHPNVFSPKHFPESRWYATQLSSIVNKDDSFLEVGVGSGIISLYVAEIGANVTSLDINPDAVALTKLNFQINNFKAKILLSDVYNSLTKDCKFKYIFFNHPWQPTSSILVEELKSEKTLDIGYKILARYIEESKKYLTDDGSLLLGTCNFAKIEQIIEIAKHLGYKVEILKRGSSKLDYIKSEVIETYFILKFNKL